MKKILTLCMIYDDQRILLGMKKRGFGTGRWNGFGGKVEEHEPIQEAALRELAEEAGVKAMALAQRGILTFHFEGDPVILEVHVFSTNSFTGEPHETDEMKPQWFLFKDIPYDRMWPDDQYWLPLLFKGNNIKGDFFFKDTNTLLNYSIEKIK